MLSASGYGVATGEADLVIKRLDDDNDARRLENALRKLEGVLEVQVSYATEKARVQYVPTIVSQVEIRRAVAAAGFEALELGGDAEDAEAAARQAEIDNQRRLLIIGVIFTVPLFILSMGMDWGLLPDFFYASTSAVHGMPTPQPWFNWLLLALAIPVQFYVGWQYYVGAFKAVRNRSANMDVLIVLGSSAAFFYSLPIVFGWLEGHVYFETAAVIITLIKLGKYLEARAKGRTSEAIKKLMGLRAVTAAWCATGPSWKSRWMMSGWATSCSSGRARRSPWTAWSSRAARRWMSRCSPANRCRWRRSRAIR